MTDQKCPSCGAMYRETTNMDAGEFLHYLGDDADKWAAELHHMVQERGPNYLDEEMLMVWFANAIEQSSDVRRWRRERTKWGRFEIFCKRQYNSLAEWKFQHWDRPRNAIRRDRQSCIVGPTQ